MEIRNHLINLNVEDVRERKRKRSTRYYNMNILKNVYIKLIYLVLAEVPRIIDYRNPCKKSKSIIFGIK